MSTQTVRTEIINNVLVTMSHYIEQQAVLMALEQAIQRELVRVNLEEITTLPAERLSHVDERNKYLIQLFMVKKRDLSKETLTSYLNAVKRLMVEINGKSLDQMDETDIDWYLTQYERRNVADGGKMNAASTVNNERRFLSAFYTWMRKAKLIADNPVESIPAKKVPRKPIDYYSAEEIARIRDACRNPRERAIVEVFRSTGARVGEIAEITLDQLDLETGMKTIGRRAGLRCRVYPHKMRKTLGMNLKNRGVDLGIIQEVLGHANPTVTSQYYAQSTPKTLRSVRERLAV